MATVAPERATAAVRVVRSQHGRAHHRTGRYRAEQQHGAETVARAVHKRTRTRSGGRLGRSGAVAYPEK